jgi:hypothetical protein
MQRFHRLTGDRDHRAEAAGIDVIIEVGHDRLRIGLERHQWWREAGQLDVAIRRCSAGHQRALHRTQYVLAPHWPAQPVKHCTICRR